MIRTRLWLLLALLAFTVWWSLRESTTATPRVEIAEPAPPRPHSTSTLLPARSRIPIGAAASDPFYGPATKLSAPPPATTAAPTPLPAAPPLPFTFLGRTTGPDGRTQIFLTRGDKLLTVKEHEVIDEQYRVERITGDEIVFVYLPLAQAQPLRAQP